MNEFGNFSLFVAWLLTLFGLIGGIEAGRRRSAALRESVVQATFLCALALGLAIVALGALFVQDDYTNQFVWQFSNASMPLIYKITAIWGGMDGSMLLWAFLLSVMGAVLAFQKNRVPRELLPWILAAFHSTTLFFTSMVLYLTNPFRYINAPFIPPDGNGLNPLLQNPYMAAHPPMLYLGFTTFAIPYAFCIGALLAGKLNNEWISLTRRWTLTAWAFLTVGIVLGGHWAYLELGWGGFWAWDPVENASFLPWLTGTAFLHSVMVQERKDMLKIWNVWLIVLTYGLTVFGTFLTRSGIVQSVHAFASTDIGWVFLAYLGLILASTAVLTYWRREELRSTRAIESLLSREAAFVLNNLVFLSITFAVIWGVMFPVLSEAVTGKKQTIGIPYFNAVTIPLFLLMLLLMGIGPLIAWRKASIKSIKRTFLVPFLSALAAGVLVVFAGADSFYATLSYSLCFFVLLTIIGEFHRGLKVQRQAASTTGSLPGDVTRLVRRHKTRYGGFLVHLGVLVMVVAITASMAHKTEVEFSLQPGQTEEIGRFAFTLNQLEPRSTENFNALAAEVALTKRNNGAALTTLAPEIRRYTKKNESTTEVALRTGLREDVYLVLAGLDDTGRGAAFKLFINPLQVWLWIGLWVVLFGTGITLLPHLSALRKTAPSSALGVKR